MATLEADSILLRYGDRTLLSDIYLSCQTEEVVALLGRNGSGKSTLLQVVFGSRMAEQQSVRVNGQYLPAAFARPGTVAYLPQQPMLPGHLLTAKAISLFCPDASAADRLRQHHTLTPLLKEPVKHLSGGERRLLEVLLVLQLPVQFVLLDEPFSQVSPLVCEAITAAIQAAAPEKGIILTDHHFGQVEAVATRLLLLHQGRLLRVQDRADLVNRGYLAS